MSEERFIVADRSTCVFDRITKAEHVCVDREEAFLLCKRLNEQQAIINKSQEENKKLKERLKRIGEKELVTITMECKDCTDKCPYFEPNIWSVKDNKASHGTCKKTNLDGGIVDLMMFCPFHEKPKDKRDLDINIDISSPFDNDKRYCQNCGAKNPTQHKYCCECGELLRPLQKNGELLKSFITEKKENVCEECDYWNSVWDLCRKAHTPQVSYSTDKPQAEHICFDCKDYQEKQENSEWKKLILMFLSIIIAILLITH